MQACKIQSADLLDIIFDGRNKSYGAYVLRKTYQSRLAKALGIAFLLTMSLMVFLIIFNSDKSSAIPPEIPGLVITSIDPPPSPVH